MRFVGTAMSSVVFLLGSTDYLSRDGKQKIYNESHVYGDVVEVPYLLEHYEYLTLKTIYSLKLAKSVGMRKRRSPSSKLHEVCP